jgi:pyruvate/2-oxoglutarate dehydrogenase complex dihydrolipoamide dehydrogenase (E3) component
MHDYDMIVIGSGPSGRRAAVQFAKLGRSVLVVEKGRRVGGVSVHTGTIPSKTLRETVLNLSGWRERGFYGRSYRVKQEIGAADLMARLQKTFDHEVEVLEHQFSRNMVRTALGEARFVGPNQIEITASSGEIKLGPGVMAPGSAFAALTCPRRHHWGGSSRLRRGSERGDRSPISPMAHAAGRSTDPAERLPFVPAPVRPTVPPAAAAPRCGSASRDAS